MLPRCCRNELNWRTAFPQDHRCSDRRPVVCPVAGVARGDQIDRTSNASIGFEARKLDHLRPFLSFVGNELAERRSRSRKYRHTRVGKPPLDVGIGEASINLSVELIDDVDGRVLGRRVATMVPLR